MQPLISEHPLTRAAEWSLVRFVRALFSPDGPEGGWEPDGAPLQVMGGLTGTGADRPLFRWLQPVIAKGTWKFLVRNGGYRKRDVIALGKRRTGRLWEEAVWGQTPLRFGAGTILWLAAVHDAIATQTESPEIERGVSAGVRRTMEVAASIPLEAGDRLALSIALLPLARDRDGADRLPLEVESLAHRLPLLGLLWPRWLSMAPEWQADDLHETLALQYLDDAFVGAWVRQENFLRRRTAAEQRAIDASLGRAIDGLFKAAVPGSGDHLLIPLTRFYPVLVREYGGTNPIAQGIARIASSLSSQTEREALEYGFGAVLRGGVRLDARVQQIVITPWADRSEAQKRLAADYETYYRPVRDDVRVLARRLCRELG